MHELKRCFIHEKTELSPDVKSSKIKPKIKQKFVSSAMVERWGQERCQIFALEILMRWKYSHLPSVVSISDEMFDFRSEIYSKCTSSFSENNTSKNPLLIRGFLLRESILCFELSNACDIVSFQSFW